MDHLRILISPADPPAAPARVEPILRSVPEWFGIEASTRGYIARAGELPTWIATVAGRDAGFVSVARPMPRSADVYCMAVHRDFHGRGIGTALVRCVEAALKADGVEYLQVKTQGPSKPSAEYARTLHFYEKVGFVPLEEFQGLWQGIPCLVLVKKL